MTHSSGVWDQRGCVFGEMVGHGGLVGGDKRIVPVDLTRTFSWEEMVSRIVKVYCLSTCIF